jgi:hypothetical protein
MAYYDFIRISVFERKRDQDYDAEKRSFSVFREINIDNRPTTDDHHILKISH